MKISSYLASLCFVIFANSASAQSTDGIVNASGQCGTDSGVEIDGASISNYSCDNVVIARTGRGTVLIQFLDQSGDDGRMLGFGGVIEGKQGFGVDESQIMAVERIYLGSGTEPVPADAGSCFLNWSGLVRTGGRLKSIVCGGRGQAENMDVKAITTFLAK